MLQFLSRLTVDTRRGAIPPRLILIPLVWLLAQRPVSGLAAGPSLPIERVLVIDEEGPTRPAFVQMMEGFRQGLAEAKGVRHEVFVETLDLVRLARTLDDPQQATKWLMEKYRGSTLDVIVPTSRLARQFVLANRDQLAPAGRVVTVERMGEVGDAGPALAKSTFVISAPTMGPTVALAHRLFPRAQRIAFIGQLLPHPRFVTAVIAETRQAAQQQGLEFLPLIDLSLPELKQRLGELPGDSLVLYHAYWRDETGQSYVPAELLETLSRESPVPFFGTIETYVGRGVVGGICSDVRELGRSLGKLVIAGREQSNPSPITVAAVPLFDERVLDRFGLSEATLPPQSRVLFREPRLWERYWRQILGGALLVTLETGLILALLRQLRLRRLAERKVNEQRDQLAHAGRISTLGQFAASLAHELGQPLGAILNNLEAAEILLRRDDSAVAGELREIVGDIAADDRRAGAVLDRIRAMVRQQKFTVRPVDVPALIQGVLTLARPRLDDERIAIKVACEPGLPKLAGDEILLQQALLNLIANSADAICGLRKNASSPSGPASKTGSPAATGTIEIRARREGNGVELAVIDSGGGLTDDLGDAAWEPFATTKSEGLGIGLPIVRSIVEQHEGQIAAENQPGSGLTVLLRLPVWRTGGVT